MDKSTREYRAHVARLIQDQLDTVNEILMNMFKSELVSTVNAWHERWPNHTFTIEKAMGSLIATIDPPFRGERLIPDYHTLYSRGAMADLIEEWKELCEWESELEFRVFVGCTNEIASRNAHAD